MYHKFGIDKRKAYYSSLIVTKQIKRNDVLEMLKQPPYDINQAHEDLAFISNKLGWTKNEFFEIMQKENRSWKDYKSNKVYIDLAVKLARVFGLERRNFR